MPFAMDKSKSHLYIAFFIANTSFSSKIKTVVLKIIVRNIKYRFILVSVFF